MRLSKWIYQLFAFKKLSSIYLEEKNEASNWIIWNIKI